MNDGLIISLHWLIGASLIVSTLSGLWFVMQSFFGFRAQLNRSMNRDLDVIRVSKAFKKADNQDRQETWKEEIGAMEQLLTSIAAIKEKRGLWHRFLYDGPSISFEIANATNNDEIVFFISIPRKFRESVEKQIHSFFPNASLEKSTDFNIFFPGSITESAILKLKQDYIFPIKTYEDLEIDPLNAITNALSKLDTEKGRWGYPSYFASGGCWLAFERSRNCT